MQSKQVTGVETIKEPRGLAVDSLRKILYVVDGDAGSPKLYAARIYHNNAGNVACEAPKLIALGLTSNWVSVDFRGKVFFVASNQILSIPVAVVTKKLDGATLIADATGTTDEEPVEADKVKAVEADMPVAEDADNAETASVVYDGGAVAGVSMPIGLAVDGYRMFWSNGENGKQDGVLVQGMENPMGSSKVNKLAANIPMAHGVCITSSRVFYTDEENNVFSTKVNGGAVTTVTDKLQKPRGCVFDGDGTVFIADHGDNKIVSFAGAGAELGPRRLSLSLVVQEPFGLAVLHGAEAYNNGASRGTAILMAIVACGVGLIL